MAQTPTLLTLAREWLNYLTGVRGFSDNTRTSYDRALDQFRMSLAKHGRGDFPADFTDAAVMDFLEDMAGAGIGRNTMVVRLAALSSFAQYLMKRKSVRGAALLRENPTKQLDWPTVEAPETHFLHQDELRAVLAVELPVQGRAARALLFDTGLRASEISRLNEEDFIADGAGWNVAVIVKGRGTHRRKLHLPLSDDVASLVIEALAARGIPSDHRDLDHQKPLLVTGRGTRFDRSTLDHFVAKLGRDAGLTRFRLSPHKIRHTVNVLRKVGGVDPFTRSKLLGQSDPRSQHRYDHIVPGALRDAKAQQASGLAAYLRANEGDL